MAKDNFEIMAGGFPVLSDLMSEICANSGSYGRDRIKVTIERFIAESDHNRLTSAIADIDNALETLPLRTEEFEDFLNYVLKSETEVRYLLQALRRGLQEALPAKTKYSSKAVSEYVIDQIEVEFPHFHQLLVKLLLGQYTEDPVSNALKSYVASARPQHLAAAIREMESASEIFVKNYEDMSDFLNYNLESESEARDLLAKLKRGFQAST